MEDLLKMVCEERIASSPDGRERALEWYYGKVIAASQIASKLI